MGVTSRQTMMRAWAAADRGGGALAAVLGCALLAVALGVVATALNPGEGVNLADLAAMLLAAVALAAPMRRAAMP